MKKLFIAVLLSTMLFTSCLTTQLFVAVKLKKQTIMCKSDSKDDVGNLMCDFTMLYNNAIYHCSVKFLDLNSEWNPVKDNGEIALGCDVKIDMSGYEDTGDTTE